MKATTMHGKHHIKAINGYTRMYEQEYFSITEVVECPVCHKHYIERPKFKGMVDGICGSGLRWEFIQYNNCCSDECRAHVLHENPFMFC